MASRNQRSGIRGQGSGVSGGRQTITPDIAAAGRGRRRRVVIGPGLILALLASAFILWGERKETAPAPRSPASTPAGKSALSSIPPPAPAPDLAFVLRQRRA